MGETSGAGARSDETDHADPADTDSGSRLNDGDQGETVAVVVTHDTPPDGYSSRPVVVWVPQETRADWDENYWRPLR